MNRISTSPVAAIASLKVSRKLPSFIQEKEMDTLLKNDYFPQTFAGKTDFLIFEILYQTGIRRNELIHLKESDVDKSSGIIKVLGKGNKERFIPVSNQLLKMIEEYISEKKKELSEPVEDFLLVNQKGKKLDPKYIYNIVKQNLSKVSTNERKSPHILRHSFATHLTNNGAEINAIKELLGHSSLASTQIYTNNSIEKLKEVYKQAHPKSEG
jgi:integrase/recombinase XerC